jgi:hypothetical protein
MTWIKTTSKSIINREKKQHFCSHNRPTCDDPGTHGAIYKLAQTCKKISLQVAKTSDTLLLVKKIANGLRENLKRAFSVYRQIQVSHCHFYTQSHWNCNFKGDGYISNYEELL